MPAQQAGAVHTPDAYCAQASPSSRFMPVHACYTGEERERAAGRLCMPTVMPKRVQDVPRPPIATQVWYIQSDAASQSGAYMRAKHQKMVPCMPATTSHAATSSCCHTKDMHYLPALRPAGTCMCLHLLLPVHTCAANFVYS